jgi:fluoride exporter
MPRDRREIAAIFAGGALGSGIRVATMQLLPARGAQFPWAIFVVNVCGCLLLGYLVTRLQERLPVTAYRRPLVGTAFCGGLTTFSTFQLQLLQMLDHGAVGLAAAYCVASVAAGFLGVVLGTAVVHRARVTG